MGKEEYKELEDYEQTSLYDDGIFSYEDEDGEYSDDENDVRFRPISAGDLGKGGFSDTGYQDKIYFLPTRVRMSEDEIDEIMSLRRRVEALPTGKDIPEDLANDIINFPYLGGPGQNQSYTQEGEYLCWDLCKEVCKKEPDPDMMGPDGKLLKGDKRPMSKPVATFIAWRLMLPKILKDFSRSYLTRSDIKDSYSDFYDYYCEAWITIHREIGGWDTNKGNFAVFINGPLKNIAKVFGRESRSASDYMMRQYSLSSVSLNALFECVEKDVDTEIYNNTPTPDIGKDPLEKFIEKEKRMMDKMGMDILKSMCNMDISEHNEFNSMPSRDQIVHFVMFRCLYETGMPKWKSALLQKSMEEEEELEYAERDDL